MATCALRFMMSASVALALALAGPAARAEEPGPAGVDLTAMDGSVLIQTRLLADGSLQFPNEMAASSWNFVMFLLAGSEDFDPDDPYALHDPSDPSTAESEGKCSFLQPQYCSSIQAFFDVRPPQPEFANSLGGLRGGGRRGVPAGVPAQRLPLRPAAPDPSALPETTRTVDPQMWLVQIPGARSPVLPNGEDLVASPVRNRNAFRAGGNTSFGRRDFVWHPETPPGCLPPRRGLSRLSSPHAEADAAALARAQRRGRCPPR